MSEVRAAARLLGYAAVVTLGGMLFEALASPWLGFGANVLAAATAAGCMIPRLLEADRG